VPIARYNKYVGGKRGAAQETLSSMISQYGEEKGKRVFYALMNKRKKKLSEQIDHRRKTS
jgi:hypothetical protein